MNRFAGSCVSIGMSVVLVLGIPSIIRAQDALLPKFNATTATCDQISSRISQLIDTGDAIVAQNRKDQKMQGTNPQALINRAANLGIAETYSSSANTLARLFASRRCESQPDIPTCSKYSSRILDLDEDAQRTTNQNRINQSLHDPAALINRVADMFIAQKESTDANTLAILYAQENCTSAASVSISCSAEETNDHNLLADSDRLVRMNLKDQTMGKKRMFLIISVPDPSALINRMSNIAIAQTEAEEANTLETTGCTEGK